MKLIMRISIIRYYLLYIFECSITNLVIAGQVQKHIPILAFFGQQDHYSVNASVTGGTPKILPLISVVLSSEIRT